MMKPLQDVNVILALPGNTVIRVGKKRKKKERNRKQRKKKSKIEVKGMSSI